MFEDKLQLNREEKGAEMKKGIISLVVLFVVSTAASAFGTQNATITVDGDPNDWILLEPALRDRSGDIRSVTCPSGSDIKAIYTAVDSQNAYIMMEPHNPVVDVSLRFEMTFDFKPGWHFRYGHHPEQYGLQDLHISSSDSSLNASIDDNLDGISEFYSIASSQTIKGNVLEISIPLSELENTTYFDPILFIVRDSAGLICDTLNINEDTDSIISASWNHNDTKIGYSSAQTGFFEIWQMSEDGTGQSQLTNLNKFSRYTTYRSDGGKIAFTSPVTGPEIFDMNPDGTNIQQLTDLTLPPLLPQYSPSGNQITFTVQDRPNLVYDIWKMNADGSNQIQLTSNNAVNSYSNWSPDGTQIVFVSTRSGVENIWVMNADGTNQQQITFSDAPILNYSPSFSPDGNKIIFSSNRSGNLDLFFMDSDGTNIKQLTTTIEHETEPVFSNTGEKIVYRKSNGAETFAEYAIEILDISQDIDSDGVFDILDNCSSIYNPDQTDTDGDDIGNACDGAFLPQTGQTTSYAIGDDGD